MNLGHFNIVVLNIVIISYVCYSHFYVIALNFVNIYRYFIAHYPVRALLPVRLFDACSKFQNRNFDLQLQD